MLGPVVPYGDSLTLVFMYLLWFGADQTHMSAAAHNLDGSANYLLACAL